MRTTRQCVPRARMRTMGENAHHAPMRTTRKWVPWVGMVKKTFEILKIVFKAKYGRF